MSFSDFTYVVNWWFLLFIIGVLWFPLTSFFFSSFFDKGYVFSKVLGMVSIVYGIFILGFFHILPFTGTSAVAVALVLSCFALLSQRKYLQNVKLRKIFLFEEGLFFVSLFFWSFVKGHLSDIHGLEKYMDFGFINSILRSTYFPPKDMWFPPEFINYYYFGHLLTGVLTKISSIPSYITFNLMLATIFACCITESFSIGLQLAYKNGRGFFLKKTVCIGFFTALLISFAGNLQTVYAFFRPYAGESPPPFWQLQFSPFSFPNLYWYPNATRFIYHTIHEFPMYSFVVSDLHGHVLDIPVVLAIIALLLSIVMKKTKINLTESALVGFLLAVAYMTNAWDGLIYFLLTCIVLLYIHGSSTAASGIKTAKIKLFSLSDNPFMPILTVMLGILIFITPFNHFFKPTQIVSGIGVLCAPNFLTNIGKIGPFLFEANHCQRSPLWQLMILWGFFYFWAISFLVYIRKRKKDSIDSFIIILIGVSTLLIIIPEFLYAKDIYPAHFRANTMFKLVYQSFIMLSLSCVYIMARVMPAIRNWALGVAGRRGFFYLWYLTIALIFTSLVIIYPFFAISSYYAQLKTYIGLDGTLYLKQLYPDDYKAIRWINSNIAGQPVMLEAQGDSYSDYERISANTGLPTVLGWSVHEWLWRGSYAVDVPRIADVSIVYESADLQKTKEVIKKYNIQYVYLGVLEREKYKNLQEGKLNQLGTVVFQSANMKIIQLNKTY